MAIEMKIKSVHILVQLDDGKIYQSLITQKDQKAIISLLSYMHDGNIQVLENPLKSLALNTDET